MEHGGVSCDQDRGPGRDIRGSSLHLNLLGGGGVVDTPPRVAVLEKGATSGDSDNTPGQSTGLCPQL